MAEPARSGCPINAAVEAFGDSWSLLVLRDVMFGNKRYFRELLAGSEEKIASNILADRLKRLVGAGLLTREDAGPGRRAAYSLTEASIQLVPVFAQLGEWGLHHRPTTERLRVRAELLSAGGPELWQEFMAELRTIHLGEPAPNRDGPSVSDLPVLELAFPGPLRDSGVAAILAGEKTALTGLLEIYEHDGEPVPQAGQRFSVIDSMGQPAAVIEVTEVRIIPISMVDDDYARAEGRGYADAAGWRRAHEDFFTSDGVAEYLGATPVIGDDTLVVTERFRLIKPGA